ncbi:MAG TPA: methyltransferase domain-containing protein [Vicinamibacterales bacterium]|nr:methyltransferase domain-containing protein [Vicinamibacterales bacterium]
MGDVNEIAAHYTHGDLLSRLNAALVSDGVDPDHPTADALAPYDQFHGRGLEATIEIADGLPAGPADHLLDVGSGIGGPARYMATRFGCRVTGVDLTAEFVAVARHLTRLAGLDDRVAFEIGDALAMPFADGTFAGAYSMNVSMNIADKAALYRELHRVLAPRGWLLLSEIAKGSGGDPDYPTPWAMSARTSFLSTAGETRAGLEKAGFEVVQLRSTADAALAYGARSRAMVARGEKPLHRAVALVHGEIAPDTSANSARALQDGRIVPIEVLARKRE